MASGNALWTLFAQDATQPSSNYATHDTVEDTSTPPIVFPCLDFDGAANEHVDFHLIVPSQYAGTTGFDFEIGYATDGSASGTVEWEVRILPVDDLDILTGDLDLDTQTAATVTDTVPATPINKFNKTASFSLAKASAGTPSAGDYIVLRLTRDPVTDTNTDDAQFLALYVTET